MHTLVRDLYKRVLIVGRDYPTGLEHVKEKWKNAMKDPTNCPSCYYPGTSTASKIIGGTVDNNNDNNYNSSSSISKECEEEIIRAVHKGRYMIKEMIGVIQLKKYRTMNQRYGQQQQQQSTISDLNHDDPVVPSK
jgi:hypothetical protein